MLVASLGPSSGAYQAVLILHILAVIVGFGALFVSGAYASQGRRLGGSGRAAVSEASERVLGSVAVWNIYAVPVLGIALVGMSNKVYKFSQAWVSVAFALYLVILVVLLAALRPAQRQLNRLLTADAPDAEAITAVEKRLAAVTGVNHLLVLVVVYLMVVKP
jgi:uncharacterized membrane protein